MRFRNIIRKYSDIFGLRSPFIAENGSASRSWMDGFHPVRISASGGTGSTPSDFPVPVGVEAGPPKSFPHCCLLEERLPRRPLFRSQPAWKPALQNSISRPLEGRVPPRPFPSRIMPPQFAHFPLIGPILGSINQTRPDRIGAHISPLFTVAFAAAQLAVPIIPLPNQSRSIFPHGETGSTRSVRIRPLGWTGSTRSFRSGRRGSRPSSKRSEPFPLPNHQAFPIGHPFG